MTEAHMLHISPLGFAGLVSGTACSSAQQQSPGLLVPADCYLYREQELPDSGAEGRQAAAPSDKAAGAWSVVSTSLKELEAFTLELGASNGEAEKALGAVCIAQ